MNAKRDEAILSCLSGVSYIARQIYRKLPYPAVDLEDLVQAGMVGVTECYAKFEDGRDCSFKTYALRRAHGACLDLLRSLDSMSRESRSLTRKVSAIEESHPLLSEEEIAAAAGMSLADLQQLRLERYASDALPFDAPAEKTSHYTLGETIASKQPTPFELCAERERVRQVSRAIAMLPRQHRSVMRKRYVDGLTMRETGLKMGVVESRVSQVHAAAVSMVRRSLNA